MDVQDQDPTGAPFFPSLALFQHVQENYSIFKALFRGQGLEFMLKRAHLALSQRIEGHLEEAVKAGRDPIVPLPVLSYYLAGALITLLQWWLDNRMPYPPERMDEIYRQLALPGALRALQLEG
jgi:AcrR family transcriptional regulator